jgi:hypothetical protein
MKFASCLVALVSSTCAFAGIVNTGGSVELIAAPADARLNVVTSATLVRVWNEQQAITLDRDLSVNASAPGLYNGEADLATQIIPTGTLLSSHYIHFDTPAGESGNAVGSVRFDGRILGVICLGDSGVTRFLDDSDFLSAGTIYSDSIAARGMELSNGEFFRISLDGRGIEFSLRASNPGDFMRVVTVPAPAGAALAAGTLLVASRRRRAR